MYHKNDAWKITALRHAARRFNSDAVSALITYVNDQAKRSALKDATEVAVGDADKERQKKIIRLLLDNPKNGEEVVGLFKNYNAPILAKPERERSAGEKGKLDIQNAAIRLIQEVQVDVPSAPPIKKQQNSAIQRLQQRVARRVWQEWQGDREIVGRIISECMK